MMNITESRLQGLLQYLALLNQMDDGRLPFTLFDVKKRVCKEIEKELGVGKPKLVSDDGEGENEGPEPIRQVIVNVDANSKRSADDIAREISDKLRKLNTGSNYTK